MQESRNKDKKIIALRQNKRCDKRLKRLSLLPFRRRFQSKTRKSLKGKKLFLLQQKKKLKQGKSQQESHPTFPNQHYEQSLKQSKLRV